MGLGESSVGSAASGVDGHGQCCRACQRRERGRGERRAARQRGGSRSPPASGGAGNAAALPGAPFDAALRRHRELGCGSRAERAGRSGDAPESDSTMVVPARHTARQPAPARGNGAIVPVTRWRRGWISVLSPLGAAREAGRLASTRFGSPGGSCARRDSTLYEGRPVNPVKGPRAHEVAALGQVVEGTGVGARQRHCVAPQRERGIKAIGGKVQACIGLGPAHCGWEGKAEQWCPC